MAKFQSICTFQDGGKYLLVRGIVGGRLVIYDGQVKQTKKCLQVLEGKVLFLFFIKLLWGRDFTLESETPDDGRFARIS